ncbi:MAG: tyrosine-protein phosphatase, partial [Bacteroidota bacterium]
SFLWIPKEPNRQHFFKLVDKAGQTVMIAERRVYFEGTDNTRDLGGYRTSDSRTVRWGKLYRSGDLSDLKKSDWDYWQNIGINRVIDFREPGALQRKPDRLPTNQSLAVRHLAVYDTGTTRKEYRRQLQQADPDVDNTESVLIKNNEIYVQQYTDTFTLAFQILLEQEQPLLYHCSAGKDRTGFMSAMILYTLGVPYETIMRDYLASNYYRSRRIRKRAKIAPFVGINSYAALPLLEVRPIYLETAFRTIEQQYGSLDAYIREGLGISDAERAQLKAKYLF